MALTKISSGVVKTGTALTNLGYTPVNKAGDTMSGALDMGNSNLTNINTLTTNSQSRFNGNTYRSHFYSFSEGTMGGAYVHMKTNVFQTTTQMYSVKFEGHDYSGSKAILCSLGWYNYQPSNGPINVGGSGSHTVSAYKSSDGYTVITIATGGYYTAFTLSQMLTTQGLADLTITAARSTSSSTGAY